MRNVLDITWYPSTSLCYSYKPLVLDHFAISRTYFNCNVLWSVQKMAEFLVFYPGVSQFTFKVLQYYINKTSRNKVSKSIKVYLEPESSTMTTHK